MILEGLERGTSRTRASTIRRPDASFAPVPSSPFRGRTYAERVSPESSVIMANSASAS